MSVLVAGLLIALSVTETYEALRSLSSMGVGIHSEISLGMFFTGCMLLLFSQLFPWRWAALSVGLAFISTLVVWIEQVQPRPAAALGVRNLVNVLENCSHTHTPFWVYPTAPGAPGNSIAANGKALTRIQGGGVCEALMQQNIAQTAKR